MQLPKLLYITELIYMLGYLGPTGTFSYIAAMEYAKDEKKIKEYKTIPAVLSAVQRGEISSAIVPIENSIEGSINTTLDMLAFSDDLYIIAEHVLRIRQNLITKPGTAKNDIKKIASHPQPIGQCSVMLNTEFPDAEIIFTDSTAAATELVKASDGSVAMIGTKEAAELNGLVILKSDCGDEENNSTRFVIISKTPSSTVTENDRTSIVFSVSHTPGSLFNALALFSVYDINMIKIESRPIKKQLGQYIFFIDIDGNAADEDIGHVLKKLRSKTAMYRFLGSYQKAFEI